MNIQVNTRMDDYLRLDYACAYIQRMTTGDRLDKAMKNAGFKTQNALALASGVPQPTIARILKGGGKRGPETETLKKLAQACKVTFSWLNGEIPDSHEQELKTTGQEKAVVYIPPANLQNRPMVSLAYVTDEEMDLLTSFREADKMGREMFKTAMRTAPKDIKKLKAIPKA